MLKGKFGWVEQLYKKIAKESIHNIQRIRWPNKVWNGPMKFKITISSYKLFEEVYQYRNGLMKFVMGQWS